MCVRADEENESSSSEDEEEEDRRRLNDELLGKVCSIENEEEPSSWYLALVNTHTHTVILFLLSVPTPSEGARETQLQRVP